MPSTLGYAPIKIRSGHLHALPAIKISPCESDQTDGCSQNKRRHPGGQMSLKAGEMATMVKFSIGVLTKFGGKNKFGEDLMLAGSSLQTFIAALKEGDHIMPTPDQLETIRTSYDCHLRACKKAGISYSPKHHLCTHMVARIGRDIISKDQPHPSRPLKVETPD